MWYTKKGDKGNTKIFDNKKDYSKSSVIIELFGALDELNTYLGLCKAIIAKKSDFSLKVLNKRISIQEIIFSIQKDLFIIQAEVAGAGKKLDNLKVKDLEEVINSLGEIVPEIHDFHITGDSLISAHFDIARTLARKAERRIVAVNESTSQKVDLNTLAYINRLSSLLFVLVLYIEQIESVDVK